MICVVIKGPTFQDAHHQISKAAAYADLVELRLDGFTSLDLNSLNTLRTQFSIPMIFTLRSQCQGGSYAQPEEKRLEDIRKLASLKPEYIDLENHLPANFIEEILKQHEIKLILSYHNFEETPHDLEEIFLKMCQMPAFFYKIAVSAGNCLDALKLLHMAKNNEGKLIAISMGSHGQISRILGPVVGSPITYAALDDNQKSAPGQLSAQTLIEQYHYRSLNPRTKIYGLIGDPVDQSISDVTHNHVLAVCGLNSVYVKIQVHRSELENFLKLAKQLPFMGLSVTMPFKEHILPYLDDTDPQALTIGAVNTLIFEDGNISGFNTDGIGALNALEKGFPVKGKRVVIIGAGGATKAIAFEAIRRGALVTILNRDADKAIRLATRLQCIGKGLDSMPACAKEGYDILINCTPSALPIDPQDILPTAVVMDIKTKPAETELIKHALRKGCRIVYGYEMFIEQALGQFDLWFKGQFDEQNGRLILENAIPRVVHSSTILTNS